LRHNRKRNKLSKKLKIIVPALFVVAILWVWKSTTAKELSRHLTGLEQQRKTLVEDKKRLLAELEQYRSISWIDSRVRANYGMTYDIKNRLILFENQKTVPRPPSHNFYAGILDYVRDVWRFLAGEK